MVCAKFPIRTGPAWELLPKPSHSEGRPVPCSGTFKGWDDDDEEMSEGCVARKRPLRTEYLSYVASWTIYWGAGARLGEAPPPPPPPPRPVAGRALHAHVAAPALAPAHSPCSGTLCTAPVVTGHHLGALLSSLGGGCAWLSLALSRSAAAPLVAGGCYLASLVATPLSVLLLDAC
ncbi:hypothetical protein MSG28_015528 [Choristoneura fumiferana]|uniref:Uncharacterized protein n=1 Tax=Choristoneura fumiferana TaxID=7141 RepID=A0ACC0KAK3_CHOFU|nr:hypothetical protein MSG28_015528 [Choristoneura fumiferana]